MIHWMFLCKFEDPQLPRAQIYPRNYLFNSTLTVSGNTISESMGPGEKFTSDINPVNILKKYQQQFFDE
jgi:hypothetical protein